MPNYIYIYIFAINEKKRLEEIGLNVNTDTFNAKISLEEKQKVLSKAKYNKAVGVDSLPNDVLKNNTSCKLLKCLFNKIFVIHVIPSAWKRAIIKPIPKISTIDPRLPLQYRGIALLSTVYKLYTSVLNNRLVNYRDENGLYAEEQNCFWQKRSCS